MSIYINRRPRIIPDQVTYIKRKLYDSGQILVSVGQEVTPADIISRSIVSAGFRTINLAKQLGVSASQANQYLQRPLGEKIYKGELLAFKKRGMLTPEKTIVAPSDGVIEFFDEKSGNLKVTYLPHEVDLPAAVYGIVENIDQTKGEILIKTQATRIYGLFGTGKSREGTLKMVGNRSDLIDRTRISQAHSKQVLVTGGLIYSGALAQAITCGVHGIITGGINSSDFRGLRGGRLTFQGKYSNDIGLSLIVCEGFGSIPIGEDIYSLLEANNNQFVILDGNEGRITLPSNQSDCIINVRKVTLPPALKEKFVETLPEVEAIVLEVGQRVRVIASPYMGDQGIVVAIDAKPTLLGSKIKTFLVTVSTRSRKIRIPYLNIEAIG